MNRQPAPQLANVGWVDGHLVTVKPNGAAARLYPAPGEPVYANAPSLPNFEWLLIRGAAATCAYRDAVVAYLHLKAATLRHPSHRQHDAASVLDAAADAIATMPPAKVPDGWTSL